MKNQTNIINKTYNKYNFYHNEWYSNTYYFDKNKNNYNILSNNIINSLFSIYFNKINILKKHKIKNNSIMNLFDKYSSFIPKITKNNINLNIQYNKYYRNIIDNIYFNISEVKYYSSKIIINLYIYNREKFTLLRKLKLLKIKHRFSINSNSKLYLSEIKNKTNLLLLNKLTLLNNKLYLYRYYTSKLFIHNMKFNTYNLIKLKKILSLILSNKIILNITNVKYFHLNNHILLSSLTKKLNKNRKNSILTLIRKGLRYAKIAKLHFLLTVKKLNLYLPKEIKGNYINLLNLKNNKNILNIIFNNSVNTHVTGLRIEAKGRLTKRLVASRAINKLKYKGSLNNLYSSMNKNSTISFKGFEKSNINYSNINSYNLLGSYGIKYWISSY
jgi:hypothetical protein